MDTNKTEISAEEGIQELYIVREFDAPRELVFQAFTKPELYEQWIGPKGYTTAVKTFEPWSGGKWRYVARGNEDDKYAFHGVFHEVTFPERIIQTFEFEGLPEPGHVILETARFEEIETNRTRVISQSVFQSICDRDNMLNSGMEQGVTEGYERLDELLEKEFLKSQEEVISIIIEKLY